MEADKELTNGNGKCKAAVRTAAANHRSDVTSCLDVISTSFYIAGHMFSKNLGNTSKF
jgi:hypothetical protein